MPKVVDHQQRRVEIASAAATVLARQGPSGFTTRRIAEEAGVSKGILDHYFSDKAELSIAVLDLYYERIRKRMRVATRDTSGIESLRVVMLEALPLDRARRDEATAEISFASQSLVDPALRRWYRNERRRFHDRLCEYIDAAVRDDGRSLRVPTEGAADLLLALMDSVSLQSVIGGDLTADDQIAVLDQTVDLIFDG